MTTLRQSSRTALLTALLGVAVSTSLWAQKFPPPEGWKWVSDDPVGIADTLNPPAGAFLFGTMAPGWHITTRPGVTLFEPTVTVRGRFVIESESFLFPGTSNAGFGVFAGGTNLESPSPSYTAFLIRRDGSAAVERREAGKSTLVQPWTRHEAILPHPGGTADVRNVFGSKPKQPPLPFWSTGQKCLTSRAYPRWSMALSACASVRRQTCT